MKNTLEFNKSLCLNASLIFGFLALIIVNVLSQFYINPFSEVFDSSLFRLQILYPTVGFLPYTDFMSIYPFGISYVSLFIDKLSFSIFNLGHFVYTIHFLLQLLIIRKAYQIFLENEKILIIFLFFSIETIVYAKIGTEPFSHLLVMLFLLYFYSWTVGKASYLNVLVIATIIIFIRWDRLISSLLVLSIYYLYTHRNYLTFNIILRLIGLFFIPVFMFIFSLYLVTGDHFFSAISNIFLDPFIISKFRNWNSSFAFSLVAFPYYLLIVFFILAFIFMMRGKVKKNIDLYIILGALALFPQTIPRPDFYHFMPFYCTSSLIIFVSLFNIKKITQYIFFLGCFSLFFLAYWAVRGQGNIYEDTCSPYIKSSQANSIYVGGLTYKNFFVNYVYLYYKNYHIKPATKYISDEPGIQSNDSRSIEIVSELRDAVRPLIIFQGLTPFNNINENYNFEHSDKIITYIDDNFTHLGDCQVNNYLFSVKIER